MPRYKVTMPDGRTYSIEGPAGASKEQVIAAIQRRIGATEKEETTLGGELKEAAKGIIPGAAGLLETAATGAAALLPEEAEMAVRGKAAKLAGAAREAFKAAPGYEESTGRKFGEALGSTAPFFALGPLGAAGRAGAFGLGVGAGAGEARQRAEMEGGEEDKGLATAAGAVIGVSEAIPVFNFVKRLPRNAQLSILDRIKRGFQAAGEEGAQEAAAQIAQNLVAKGLYKPSQELIESAGEEGAYGAGVGAFIQVLTDMALGRRVRGVQPEPSAEEKLVEKEEPSTAPPGTQAAAKEEVTKLTDEKQKVQDVIDEEDEARREREAIQAYEREREQDLTATYDEDTLREAAEAERLAPVDEDVPYMPPAEEAAEETVEPVETREEITVPETVREEPTEFVAPSDFRYTLVESPNYDLAPLSPEDADFELEVLQQQAERGRLTPQNFVQSEIGTRLDTVQIGKINEGLRTDPVNTIKALREQILPPVETAVTETVVEPAPAIEEPEYTMRDAALEVFRETGKTNVDTLRDRLAIPLQEAKELRQSLIDEGVLVRRGNTYILQEVEPAPTAEAEEVKDADIRARDIEEVDTGAVGRGDVLPPSRPVSAGQVTAEPAVAAVERVSEPPAVAPAREERVEPALEDIEAAQEELEAAQTPERPTSIRAAALDFVRETGKADPIRLQQALGIKLSEANALREALIGSGAIVPVQGKRNFYAVFEDLRTAPQIPAREGRIEGESLVATRPEVLQGAPRPARKEAPVDAAAEAAAVAQAQQRREETRGLVEDVKATIRKLVEAPGTQQYGLNLVGGEARGVTRKKLSPVEVNNAKALGLDREAVAYASNPSDADVRRTLLTALNNKHRELLDRAVALQKLETSNRINRRETTLKNSLFRNIFGNLRDPQLTVKDLVTVEQQLKDAETKLGQRAAPEVAPEQARIAEDDVQFREAVERSKEREAADKEQRKVKRLGRKDRDIGLRFERGKGAGMDADRVYEIADKIASTWKNPPRIFVVQSISELPDSLRDRVPSDAKGFYIRGDVFLIGDNLSSDAGVKATLFHESLGHYGIRTIFGRRLRQTLLDIYRTNPAMRKAADKWIKNNSDTYANLGAENERSMAVEEVLAEASSQGVIKDAGIRAAFNRVAALVRKFLRGMGFQINYSNNDIRQILIEAHDSVTTKRREQVYGDGTIAYERKKAEARLSNVFDVNLTAPRYDSKIGDGVRGALERVGENLRDAAIGLLSVSHIAEVWQSKMPAIEKLDRIINERGATEMRRREEVATNVTKWFDLSNKYRDSPGTLDKFFQIANLTTVYQVDPLSTEKGRPGLVTREVLKKPKNEMNGQERAGYDIIKAYDALPADLRAAYKDLREAYKKKGDELFYLMEQRLGKDVVDKLKAKYDSKRLEVYLPLWRSGNYWLTYTDKNNETITSAYASDVDRQRAMEAAKRQGGKDFTTFSRLSEARRNGPPPTGFLGDVVREMEAKGAPQDMIDAVYETFLNYLPAQSIRQQLQSREESYDFKSGTSRYGVFGFEPDVFQAYANVATRMANQLTNLEYAIPFEETMKEIKKQAGGERITEPTLRSVYTNLEKKVEFIRNPEANWFVDKSSYFSYLWYIAGNMSSALINTTQLPMVVMPLLGGKYGYDKGFTAMERAMGMYFNGGWDTNNGGKSAFPSDYTFGAAKNLKPRHKRLYDAAVSRSAIRRSTGYEITEAQKSGVEDYTGIGARVTHGLGWVFQNSERFNREVTLLAAFDLAFEKTGDEQKAIDEAIKLVNDAHGPALAEAGPRLFQSGIGKVMFTFKRFAQAQIYLLAKLFNQAFRDADPTTREVARSQLIGIFGSSFLIAGLQGMPMYGAVEFLANLLMGDDDEPYDFTAYVNSKFSETGRKGLLNQMIGADVASRTGFNGLIWREDPRRMSEVGVLTYGLEQALGPAYAAFINMGRGIELFKEGEYQRSIEAFAPSFIRNGLKAMRIAEEGVRAKDGTPIVEDISKYNVMMQAVGFNPADAAEARERAGFDYKIQKELLNRRSALLDKYYAAWQEDDQEGMDEALDSIAKFNEKNPQRGLRITGSTLIKSIKGRVTRQELSVDGLYMPMPIRSRVQELLEGGS